MKFLLVLALLCAVAAAAITPVSDVFTACNDAATQGAIHDSRNIGPGFPSRRYAMVHAAQYNAWNSITNAYKFTISSNLPKGPAGASPTAAAAQACYDVLMDTDADQKSRWDAFLQEQLALVSDGDKDSGIQVGKAAAAEIVKLRANDGWEEGNQKWEISKDKCGWQPDPLSATTQSSWGYGWGNVNMWAAEPIQQWPKAPPPALESKLFEDLYQEAYTMGAKNSKVRSKEQLEVGLWWAYDNKCLGFPNALYNRHLQEIAYQQKNTHSQNAALFALANIAMADACNAAWYYKFLFDLGRPVTIIRNGCTGNPNNKHDPDWEPFGGTCKGVCAGYETCSPPFAADPSGHATFGGAVYESVKNFYGKDISFWGTSEEVDAGPVRRDFKSLDDAAFENAQSRIYLGIHWGCDRDDGIRLGRYAADRAFQELTNGEFGTIKTDNPVFPIVEPEPASPKEDSKEESNSPNAPVEVKIVEKSAASSTALSMCLAVVAVAAVILFH